MAPINVGQVVRLKEQRRVRVVGSERNVDLPARWTCAVEDVALEFGQALVAVTSSGPLVWVDLEDLQRAD